MEPRASYASIFCLPYEASGRTILSYLAAPRWSSNLTRGRSFPNPDATISTVLIH